MAQSGLLEQAKQRRYRLTISPGDSAELSFEIVSGGEPVLETGGDAPQGANAPTVGEEDTATSTAGAGGLPPAPAEEEDPDVRAEIENLVAGRRISSESVVLRRGEGRLGIGLPVVVNVLLALIVAGALYTVTTLFNTREEAIAVDTAEVFSTESRIIEELIRTSEEELSRKEAEINAIESQLSDLAESKAALEEGLDQEIARREEQLRAQLEQELQAERERLEALGTSEAEIAAQIEALESARTSDVESELASYRNELEAEFETRISELEAQSTALEEQLSAERVELQAQVARAQEAASTAEARLSNLEREQQVVGLFQDQLAGAYERVFQSLREDDYAAARDALSGVDEVFQIPTFAGVGGIQARRDIDRRITTTIADLIDQEERSAGQQAALQSELAEIEGDAIAVREELLARQQEEIGALEDRIAELTASLGEARSRSAELEGNVTSLEDELAEVRADRSEAVADRATLREENATLRQQIENFESRVSGLEDQVADLRNDRATLAQTQGDLERELARARESIRNRDAELREARAALAAGDARRAEVEADLATLQETRRQQSERIAELETEIEEELQNPERVTANTGTEGSESAAPRSDAAEVDDVWQFRRELLGIVTSTQGGDQLVVRSLVAGGARQGDRVQIRRRSSDGSDTLIADGRILDVASGLATVEVLSLHSGSVQRADTAFVLLPDGAANGAGGTASSAESP